MEARQLEKDRQNSIPEHMVQELVLEGHPREYVLLALRDSYNHEGKFNTDLAYTLLVAPEVRRTYQQMLQKNPSAINWDVR